MIQDNSSGEQVIVIDVPILDTNGEFSGVLQATMLAGKLQEEINRIQISETSYAYLVSASGIYLAHPTTEKIGKKFSEYANEDRAAFSQVSSTMRNTRRLASPCFRHLACIFSRINVHPPALHPIDAPRRVIQKMSDAAQVAISPCSVSNLNNVLTTGTKDETLNKREQVIQLGFRILQLQSQNELEIGRLRGSWL